jgi:hypothetical protein
MSICEINERFLSNLVLARMQDTVYNGNISFLKFLGIIKTYLIFVSYDVTEFIAPYQ